MVAKTRIEFKDDKEICTLILDGEAQTEHHWFYQKVLETYVVKPGVKVVIGTIQVDENVGEGEKQCGSSLDTQ